MSRVDLAELDEKSVDLDEQSQPCWVGRANYWGGKDHQIGRAWWLFMIWRIIFGMSTGYRIGTLDLSPSYTLVVSLIWTSNLTYTILLRMGINNYHMSFFDVLLKAWGNVWFRDPLYSFVLWSPHLYYDFWCPYHFNSLIFMRSWCLWRSDRLIF